MRRLSITSSTIDKDKIFAILKEARPDLDLSDGIDVTNAIDSLFFSLVVGTSHSASEIVGRLELIKQNAVDFLYSDNVNKYQKMIEEKLLEEKIKKSKTEAG
jgi:hypothetical protein